MESLFVALASLASAVLVLRNTDASVPLAAGFGVSLFLLGKIAFKIGRALIVPFYFSELRNVPGPKDNQFLVGQAIRLLKAPGPNDLYLEWVRKWPDAPFIRHLNWGNSEVLLVNNLEAAREVLQTHAYSFVKPSFFLKLVGEMMGIGILFSVGEQHKQMRRIMAGPLSKPSVRKMLPIFQDKARELSATFDEAIEGEDKGVVEASAHATIVESLFSRTAFKVISTALLSREISEFRSKSSPLTFEQCYKGILTPPLLGKLITFINPFIPLRWLPIEANLAFIRANTALRAMLSELIQERVLQVQQKEKSGRSDEQTGKKDFLTIMIEANLAEKKGVSEKFLVDTIIQCVSAGHETTAGALTWTTYALTQNPEIQKRLREEILSAQQKQPELDAATIDSLPYLNNVVSESLRVYSPTLLAPWEAGEDLVIAGVAIPKGTTVTTIPAMIHYNPSVWGADVEVFNPDRWDTVSGAVANPFSIEAFINGPRTCPGRALALLEIKTVLAEMVSNFYLEAVDTDVQFEHPTLTLKPKGGLRVRCDGEKPLCGTCQSHGLTCHYEPARPTRRQKYWDRDYVQALEDQVRLLSASLQQAKGGNSPDSQPSPGTAAKLLPYGPKLLKALRDFGSMKWADIIGRDGRPVLAGPGRFSVFSNSLLPTFEDASRPSAPKPAPSHETFIAEMASNLSLKQHLKTYFLENVNPYYKFVDPIWLNFSDMFPHNDTALQLLYGALFAAAAYSSPMASREIADAFMAYAESLVQQCYLEHLCLPVLQALLIMAWYKHMLLDTAKGHLYHYIKQQDRSVNDVATIRTFWSLYFLDRYTSGFDNSSPPEKQAVYAKANSAMLAFRKQIDKRLYISRNMKPHKTQVVFWISYHSSLINLQRPLLNPTDPGMIHNIPTAFRSSTASAMAITRLLKSLQASDEVQYLPPFIIYHIFRAALVHGLNLIAVEEMGDKRMSSGNFWACFRVLGELSSVWKELCEGAMPFVLMATRGWGFQGEVMSFVEEAEVEEDGDYEIGLHMIDELGGDLI
ncbi:cytochrome p450 [Trichoderma arundinaceum]|uniref:Cytochrome p450 n=1 Tax=Trichoderma arundinaceum TaxID=490622 RepID=A0A395NQV6_TRIAR|nr:cytochrome p450 [Trichoderma arundinaceum]